jgi:hypothetical protein
MPKVKHDTSLNLHACVRATSLNVQVCRVGFRAVMKDKTAQELAWFESVKSWVHASLKSSIVIVCVGVKSSQLLQRVQRELLI